ncbi:MAG: LacI family DNA-binding transcriptional regulator [Alkalispirochaetaceae bacterium]
MATIKDVAELAGVSTTTVSRVLNRGEGSEEVKRRVNRAVKLLNYQVSASARGLKRKFTNIVGVIVADISNPPTSQMFHGVARVMHDHRMTVMLGNSEAEAKRELELIEMFARQRAAGVIYAGKGVSERAAEALNAFPSPVVVATQESPETRWPTVLFDNYRASYEVTSKLIDRGHRRIGYISAPLDDREAGVRRQEGHLDALAAAGIREVPGYLQHAEFSVASGYAAMERMLLQAPEPPTAVATGSDLIAIGAMRSLRDQNIRVPEEVSLFGFDNIPVCSKLIPSLSSVWLDFYELGEVCADLLYRMVGRGETQVERVILHHKIEIRESLSPVGG